MIRRRMGKRDQLAQTELPFCTQLAQQVTENRAARAKQEQNVRKVS